MVCEKGAHLIFYFVFLSHAAYKLVSRGPQQATVEKKRGLKKQWLRDAGLSDWYGIVGQAKLVDRNT